MPSLSQATVQADIRRTRSQLRKFAPEVLKELDKANREAAKPVITAAKNSMPPNDLQLTNWTKYGRYKWDTAEAKRGIKFKQDKKKKNQRYSAVLAFFNQTAAGAIWELAGYRSTSLFTKYVTQVSGPAPRGIWRQLNGTALANIREKVVANYRDAEQKLNEQLKANV